MQVRDFQTLLFGSETAKRAIEKENSAVQLAFQSRNWQFNWLFGCLIHQFSNSTNRHAVFHS